MTLLIKGLTRYRVCCLGTLDIFSENDRKSSVQMEVNMTMQEPRASVISLHDERMLGTE